MNILQLLKSLLKNPLICQFKTLWKKLTADWSIHLEKPVLVTELAQSREAASIPSFSFFFLLTCASIIATFGLLANSNAVIIGAMIVAPLMNPILSMAFALVTDNWDLCKRSITTIFLGVLCTIFISFLISAGLPINIVGSELVANRIASELHQIRKENREISKQTQIRHIDVRLEGTTAYVSILVNAPQGLITDEYLLESAEKRLFESVSKMGVKSMNAVIRITPVEINEYKFIAN